MTPEGPTVGSDQPGGFSSHVSFLEAWDSFKNGHSVRDLLKTWGFLPCVENFLEIPFGRCIADRPLVHGSKRLIPSGKRLQFANLKIAHRNFVELPIKNGDFPWFFVNVFQRITGDGLLFGSLLLTWLGNPTKSVRSFSQGFRPCLTTLKGITWWTSHLFTCYTLKKERKSVSRIIYMLYIDHMFPYVPGFRS